VRGPPEGDGTVRILARLRGGRKPLYANQAFGQLGHGVAAPFVPYYATRLGATTADLGWLTAFSNLFPNLLQYPWGRMSDRVGRRVPFIAFGTILSASLFLLIAASATPWQLILVVLVQAIAASIVAPTWSALLGERSRFGKRGWFFGRISRAGGIASLFGTLLAAVIVVRFPGTSAEGFHLGFVLAAAMGIGAGLVMLLVRERKAEGPGEAAAADPAGAAERRADFLHFTKVQSFYNFFMALAWPLIPITVAIVLGATNFDIVMIAVVSAVSTVVLQSQVGRLLDRVGPVPLIQASRFLFVLVPLAYAFAPNLLAIYMISAVMGVPTAIVNVAFNAYILDVAPPTKHAGYFGTFNGAIGIVTFAGTLIGGYLAHALLAVWALPVALMAVYLVSAAGRAAGAFLSLRIHDPARYPESVGEVWERFEHQIRNGGANGGR